MVLGKNLALAVEKLKENDFRSPSYVLKIKDFSEKVIMSHFGSYNDEEFKILALRLIYMHLNGNKINLGDEFKEIITDSSKSKDTKVSVSTLLTSYEFYQSLIVRLFDKVYFSTRRANGINKFKEIVKDI